CGACTVHIDRRAARSCVTPMPGRPARNDSVGPSAVSSLCGNRSFSVKTIPCAFLAIFGTFDSDRREARMQPQDVTRVLSDPLAQELMQSSIPARLAYLGPDGFPRAIPIGFHWNGIQFVLCTVPHAPKVSALKTNPKVAFTVDTNAFPPHVLLVRGTAAIDIVDGVPPEYLAASRKGVGPEQWDAFEAQVRAMYKQMARIKITPLWAKLLDFQTRF